MKKNNKLFRAVFAIAMIVLTVGACFSFMLPTDIADFLYGSGAMGLAMAAGVAGPGKAIEGAVTHETVEGAAEQIHEVDLDRLIVKVQPSAAIVDQIIREMGSFRKAKGIETGGWEVGTRAIKDTVSGAVAASATNNVEIPVTNPKMWTKQTMLFVHGINGGDAKLLGLYIYEVDSLNSKIKCIAVNPTTTVGAIIPAIAQDTVLQRLGTANNERDAQAIAYSLLPSSRTNYCQTFIGQVEEGVIEGLQLKRVDLGFEVYKQQKLWDFRREIESSFLFGHKGQFDDPVENKTIYTCDGIWHQAEKSFELPTTITDADFIEMTEYAFANQNGSDRKILLAGSGLIADLLKTPTYSKQLESRNTEMVMGIKFNIIETNFGEILIKRHELFDGGLYRSGMILDPAFLVKEQLEHLKIEKLDLNKSGQARVDAERILETACPFLKNLPTHCKITRA